MKRIKIAIAVMAVILIAALGIYFLASYFNTNKTKKENEEADKLILFNIDEDSIDKVDIHNETGNYIAEYIDNNGWELTNSDEFELNSSAITAICSNFSHLTASKILDDTDTSKYGFDNPITLTVYTGDTSYKLLIGDATPTYENFYVMKENDDNIYLIDYTTGTILCATKNALKQTYVINFFTSEIDYFCLWEGAEKDENIRFSMKKDANGTWSMDKPYQDTSVYNTQITNFLADATRDEIFSFVAENCPESDYGKYGFDNPKYVLEVTAGEKHTKVIFGDYTNNENEMYGLFTDSGQVVTFISNEIAALGYDTMDMMNTTVYSADINDVTEVKVETSDFQALMEINSHEEKYVLNGTQIKDDNTKSAFISFFNSFNNTYFESIENNQKPEGEPEITITYTLSNNTVNKIEYIPVPGADSNTYWAVKNNEYTGFVVRKKIIANISSSYEELAEAVESSEK